MSAEFSLIGQKGNIRRFGRLAESFDPNAIDADGDGVVQEGTPFKRPAAPNARLNRGPVATRMANFWDYGKPKPMVNPLDDELPDDAPNAPDAPKHKPWRDVNISPKRSGSGVTEMNPHVFKINTDKITSNEWNEFKDDILDYMVPDDDSVEQDKDYKRGIMKLYATVRAAKINKNDDGSIVLNLTDYDRARIIKGIKSMHKKDMKARHMRTIMNLLLDVEKDQKSFFVASGENTSRPFVGTRYKSAKLIRTVTLPDVLIPSLINPNERADGFRVKGESPRQSIDLKALGRAISGRNVTRSISSRFDPNAVDADGDGLVQEGTTFQRPGTNKPNVPNAAAQMRRLIKPETIERGPMRESIVKPKKPNNVLKAQADRRALDFQLSKLRSTLGRVGNDYVPKWWDNGSEDDFKKKISMESPEVLAEIFGRIYVERRSMMVTKVGRKGDGSLKAYIDSPSAEAKKRNEMLKKRGEAVYREMYGRLLGRQDLPAAERKKQADKFYNWFQIAADNSDWYLNQSFKITKRKSRKKLGIESPVNRRGTRWSEDPNFPSDAFDNVVASIERDLINANPRISRDRANSRAKEIVKAQERRLGRTPNKSPRISGDREIVGNRRLARRVSRLSSSSIATKSISSYGNMIINCPTIKKRDANPIVKKFDDIKKANVKKFGKLDSRDDFKKAFKSLSPDIKCDMFRGDMSRPLEEIDKATLHGFLHTFTVSPEILEYPVFIKKLKTADAMKGIGGSHSIDLNLNDPNVSPIGHELRYSSAEQNRAHFRQQGIIYSNNLLAGGSIQVGMTDTISGQIMKNYLSKRINSGTPTSMREQIIDDAIALKTMMTALHEGGHAAHAAAMITDYYGKKGFDAKALKARVNTELAKLDAAERLNAARGIAYSMMDDALVGLEADKYGNTFDVFQQIQAGNVDVVAISKDVASGKTLTDLLNNTSPSQTRRVQALNQMIAGEALDSAQFHEALAVFGHIAEWQMSNDRYEVSGVERILNNMRNDTRVPNTSLFYAVPLDSNGKLDVAAMFDKNKTVYTTSGTINWFSQIEGQYFLRLKNFKYSYDGLTKDESAKAQAVMNQLSGYAAQTRKYGWAFGNSNVESIAELNAADVSEVIKQMNIPASDMALLNKLLNWMRRPSATPPATPPSP